MRSVSDSAGFVMYGAEFSLYSGKLRSYLYKKGVPFREQRPWALTYKRFIQPRTGVSYIPVLQTPEDEVWQDTTVIIDQLEARYPASPMVPIGDRRRLAARLLELYGDEWLLILAMHYRWNAPESDLRALYEDFGTMLIPRGPAFFHRRLGKKLAARFRGFLPSLGITEATTEALEVWYIELLAELEAHFQVHHYLLGERPTIADFGFIGPFYAHLYRDPRPRKMMRARAPRVVQWVERMMSSDAVSPETDPADKDDEIPDSIMPLLQRFTDEQLPVLRETAGAVDTWAADARPGQEVPRLLGKHRASVAGVSCQRRVIPYSLWRFQRVLEDWRSSQGPERVRQTELLRQMGAVGGDGASFESWGQGASLERIDNRLYLRRQ